MSDSGRSDVTRRLRLPWDDEPERQGPEREFLRARPTAEESELRVQLLEQIVADLAVAGTEAEVADVICRAPGVAFDASSSTVYVVDVTHDRIRPSAATKRESGDPETLPRSSPHAVARVAHRGDLHVVGSLEQAAEHFPDLAEAMRRAGMSTVVLLPLTVGTGDEQGFVESLGVLTFAFADPRQLSDSELRMVRLFGQLAGQALDRVRLTDAVRRRERRMTYLAELSSALQRVPQLVPRARQLIERIVPTIADWASVRLEVSPSGLAEEAGGPAPEPDLLAQRLAVGVAGQPVFPSADDPLDCAVLPLTALGRVVGTLALRPCEGAPDAGERAFLLDLAERAGLALENAWLYEREQQIARTLQRSLLAGDLPQGDSRFTVQTHYQVSERDLDVGGDWFDAFLITPDKVAVAVGDVAVRGIDAATTMAQLRSAVRALASASAGPGALLDGLDRFVERVPLARMARVAYAEVDLTSGELAYACAGHLPPLLHEPAGGPEFLGQAQSAALGSQPEDVTRMEHRRYLRPGSRLLLYTDGLIERRNRPIEQGFEILAREFGLRRDAPVQGLAAALADLLVGRDHADDVCLLCLTLGIEERIERSIGADRIQIALLRADLRGWLDAHGVDPQCRDAVLLACSEAVANAIEHGYRDDPFGMIDVVATVSPEAVEVQVTDHGTWRSPVSDAARGRGLQLIRQSMDVLSFDRSNGTTVTMRRRRTTAR